jgi:hypothetical protein
VARTNCGYFLFKSTLPSQIKEFKPSSVNCRIIVRSNAPMFLKLLQKELPEDGSCEPKHVALCDLTLKCCVGRHIFCLFVCLFVYEFMNLFISIHLMIRFFEQLSSLLDIHKLCSITFHAPSPRKYTRDKINVAFHWRRKHRKLKHLTADTTI